MSNTPTHLQPDFSGSIANSARVQLRNKCDQWFHPKPARRLIAPLLARTKIKIYEKISIALLCPSLSLLSAVCIYTFHLIIDWGRSVCVLLVQIRQKHRRELFSSVFEPGLSSLKVAQESSKAISVKRKFVIGSYLPCIFGCNNWHVGLIGELQGRRAQRHYRSNILLRVCCYASHLKIEETQKNVSLHSINDLISFLSSRPSIHRSSLQWKLYVTPHHSWWKLISSNKSILIAATVTTSWNA